MLRLVLLLSILFSLTLSYKNVGFYPWIIDFVHLFVIHFYSLLTILIIYEIAILKRYDVIKLLFINIVFLVMVLGLTVYGMCPLTILYNKAANLHTCTPFYASVFERVYIDTQKQNNFLPENDICSKNTRAWLNGQMPLSLTILSLNILFIWHYTKAT